MQLIINQTFEKSDVRKDSSRCHFNPIGSFSCLEEKHLVKEKKQVDIILPAMKGDTSFYCKKSFQ